MTRITHQKAFPKTIVYWDYYILCRLNNHARIVLQQMEYWDGTKAQSNLHSEQINDQMTTAGEQPTQEISRFVYKTQEELAWEISGQCSERSLPKALDFLRHTLHYLIWRPNPYNSFDRTGQYAFCDRLVQSHLDRLAAIVKHFRETLERRERPVLYAIEQLTEEGHSIAHITEKEGVLVEEIPEETQPANLSIELVAKKLRAMHKLMHEEEEKSKEDRKFKYSLPRFIRSDLKKDEIQGFGPDDDLPSRSRNFAESKQQIEEFSTRQDCGMDSQVLRNGFPNLAAAIPVTTTVTTDNDNEESESADSLVENNSPPSSASNDARSPSLLEIGETIVPTEENTPNTPGKTENDSHSYSQQTQSVPNIGKKLARKTKQSANVTEGPISVSPTMPTVEDAWTPEMLLQVFEARLGRRYPNGAKRAKDRVRDVELESCRSLHEMADLWGPDTGKNAKRLDRLINQLESRHEKWWLNTNGRVMPHNLVEKDRAHQMLDELRRERDAKKQEGRQDGRPKMVGNLAYFSADQLGA